MTNRYRVCAFGIIPPTIELFGRVYGVCALAQECPPGECGYARSCNLRAAIAESCYDKQVEND
jgi:hypothetical protein